MHNSLKEQILDCVDIVDVVGEHVALTRKGREFVGLCPFHNDHRPSMSVSPQKQIFKCWSCLAGGNAIKFTQLIHRVEYREALEMLAQRAGIDTRQSGDGARATGERERLRSLIDWANSLFQKNLRETDAGRKAADYARGRGLTDATIERFGLGYAAAGWRDLLTRAQQARITLDALRQAGLVITNDKGNTYDRFRHRLIFPIHDVTGRCIAFGGRTLGDDEAKYLNSPESSLFSKSRVLYGMHMARRSIIAERRAIVVEGYLDAVLLSQAGVENVVATLGTALTDSHMKLLRQCADQVVMCFDNDEAGLRAADRAVEAALRHRTEVSVVVVPDGKDPADYVIGQGAEAFKSLLHSAIPALEFKWHRTLQAYRARGRQSQREAVEEFLQFVARVSMAGGIDPLEQGLLVGRLADLLAIPGESIYALIARAKATASRQNVSRPVTAEEECTSYDREVQDVPRALAVAIEELFGLALAAPEHWEAWNRGLAAGARYARPWARLYEVLLERVAEQGSYTKEDVLEACEDETLLELLDRLRRHMPEGGVSVDMCERVVGRVLAEVDLMGMETLREHLRQGVAESEEQARVFRSLRERARRQHGPLGAAQRWQATAGTDHPAGQGSAKP